MRVQITFTPYDEDADPKDDTGLTSEAFDRLMAVLPGEDVTVKRVEDDDD